MQLRCPDCRQITSDRVRTFPHCLRCGRQLAECQYCLDFNAKTGICRFDPLDQPKRVDPHAVPTCGHHRSRLDPAHDPLRHVLHWATPLVAAVALFAVMLWAWSAVRAHRDQPRPAATLEFVGNPDVSAEAPTTFYLSIRNTGSGRIRNLELRLGSELLDACDLVSLKPTCRSHVFDAQEGAHCYRFGPLDAGGTLQVELTVKSRQERLSRVCWKAEARGDEGEVLARTDNVMQITP
jgi:hypothetical protein